jgi:DNA-binding NarL/FixJ family response regulator
MEPFRVLIADDHPIFRHGVQAMLATAADLICLGEARTGQEAVDLAASLQPDVVLMDLQMPELNGIQATRRILAASPQIRVLMVTMFEDDASVFTAMKAGARGYVLKDAEKPEILRAIAAVGHGEAIFSPAIAGRVLDYFTSPRPAANTVAFPQLTGREHEILNLIAQGHGNQDIARRLVLTHSTVRNYVSSIFSKLQVADRPQAIVQARRAGLGKPGPRPPHPAAELINALAW